MRNRSMSAPEHTVLSMVLENVAAIVTGATVVLLALLTFLGKGKQAAVAKAVLTETPVSHAELVSCQLEVTNIITTQFEKLRAEFMKEVKDLHEKLNNHSHL